MRFLTRAVVFSLKRLEQVNSQKRLLTFGSLFSSAEHKLRAVQWICEEDDLHCENAPLLLLSAWRDLSKAIALHREVTTDESAEDNSDGVFNPGGHLSAVLGNTIARESWLEAAAKQYCDFKEIHVTRSQCESAVEALFTGLNKVHSWHLHYHASLLSRVYYQAKIVLFFAILLSLISVAGYGVYEYAARPDESNGLSATYFAGQNLRGHPFMWVDQGIDFNWEKEPPFRTYGSFSIRWEGCIDVEEHPKYLEMRSEKPYKVWVDSHLYAQGENKEKEQQKPTPDEIIPTEPIARGIHYIVIEMPQVRIPATIALMWRGPNDSPTPVPAKSLVPIGGNEAHECQYATPPNFTERSR